MKKKILAIALVLAMIFTLAACGEEASTVLYSIDGCGVPMFKVDNVSNVLMLGAEGKFSSASTSLSSIDKGQAAYIYVLKSGKDAASEADTYCNSLVSSGSGLDRYIKVGQVVDKAVDSLLSTINLGGLDEIAGTTLLFNAKTTNIVLVSHITIMNLNVVIVVPDLVEAAGGTDLLKSLSITNIKDIIATLL